MKGPALAAISLMATALGDFEQAAGRADRGYVWSNSNSGSRSKSRNKSAVKAAHKERQRQRKQRKGK